MREIKLWVWMVFLGILILAAFVRFDFVASVQHEVSHDSLNYHQMAKQIIEKHVYGYKSEEPNAYVTPGYPMFLAITYKLFNTTEQEPLQLIRYIQASLSLAIVLMVFILAHKFGGSIIALIAGLITALYPPFVWANGAILTEVLGTFFFLLYFLFQVYTFERDNKWLAALTGILLGLTVLTRPEFLPVMFILYGFYYIWKRKKITIQLFLISFLAFVMTMMPWWIRNVITLDEFVLLATQQNPFYAGTFPEKNYNDGLIEWDPNKSENEMAFERLKVGFTEHTWTFIKWYTIGKLDHVYWNMYYGTGFSPWYNVIPFNAKYLHQSLIVLGIMSVITVLIRWKQPLMLVVLIIGLMTAVRLLYVPEARYNFTMMHYIIILDIVVLGRYVHWLLNKRKSKLSEQKNTVI